MSAESKRQVLVIDDDEFIQTFLKRKLTPAGFEITTVSTGEAAVHRLQNIDFYNLILSDLKMPGMSGLELLEVVKRQTSKIPVILMTAHASVETAIEALKKGAFDYVTKPLNIEELVLSMEKALQFTQLERDNKVLREELRQTQKSSEMIGKSRAIRNVFELVNRVAPTQANVLITGESGTGKELVARALHNQSPRHDQAFVAINCSAIPADLLESELFGHAKGSFTGAFQAKKGLFEEANGGTIFLDEIGDLEMSLQAKLLRVLQERKIRPVGENKARDIDVRILAATHKDLRAGIVQNRFREDLYYRLCVIPIEIPPLRQRKEDIPLLAEHFVKRHAATHGVNVVGFTPDGMGKLVNYPWPGNVRELENIIERSVILSTSDRVTAQDLAELETKQSPSSLLEEKASELLSLEAIEKQYIAMILRRTGGKKERAAQILGIDRKTLRRKEREYGLVPQSELDNEEGFDPGLTFSAGSQAGSKASEEA